MTWTHFKFSTSMYHISITKTLLPYIFDPKVSYVHAHDTM